MRVTRPVFGVAVLVLVCCGAASAQTTPTLPPTTTPTAPETPTAEGLTLAQTLGVLARTAGGRASASALALATSLEVGTTPLITASPSFTYKVDPATGLRVRQATTFGPSFAERALTSGEGKVAVYASVTAASYEQLGDFSLERMELTNATGPTAASTRKGITSLVLQAETLLMSSSVGVTDKLESLGGCATRPDVGGWHFVDGGRQRESPRARERGRHIHRTRRHGCVRQVPAHLLRGGAA